MQSANGLTPSPGLSCRAEAALKKQPNLPETEAAWRQEP
jgi:hypothetical protein